MDKENRLKGIKGEWGGRGGEWGVKRGGLRVWDGQMQTYYTQNVQTRS